MPQYTIICFGSSYWDESIRTNQHYHMTILAQTHRILYIEPGLSWLGVLRGWKRLPSPWKRFFPWIQRVQPSLYTCYLPILPGTHFRFSQQINRWFVSTMLTGIVKLLRFEHSILWLYHPHYVHLLNTLRPALVVYDCVDEFAEYPSMITIRERIWRNEQELIRVADLVLATSPHLYRTRKQMNPQTYYLPNAADFEIFKQARLSETVIPEKMAAIPSPVLGFVGAISAYKLDIPLLCTIAKTHPDWHVVLIGRIGEGETTTDLGELPTFPNIHFLGPKPLEILPGYLKHCDLCLIPYQLNEYTQGVFPMKFYEYLATGKPIVTTALPALLEFDGLVKIAHSHEAFIAAIEQVLRDDPEHDREARLNAAKGHTWEARTTQILNLITERLYLKEKRYEKTSS